VCDHRRSVGPRWRRHWHDGPEQHRHRRRRSVRSPRTGHRPDRGGRRCRGSERLRYHD
jgi:hypothetical protein